MNVLYSVEFSYFYNDEYKTTNCECFVIDIGGHASFAQCLRARPVVRSPHQRWVGVKVLGSIKLPSCKQIEMNLVKGIVYPYLI